MKRKRRGSGASTFPNNVWPPRAATTEFALNPDTNTNTNPTRHDPFPCGCGHEGWSRRQGARGGQWQWGEGQPWAFVVSGRRRVLEKLLLVRRITKCQFRSDRKKAFDLFLSQRDVTRACCLFLARKLARISSWKSSSNLSKFDWGLTCDYPVNYWGSGFDYVEHYVNYDIISGGNT